MCYICKKKLEDKHIKNKKHRKVRDHCHYTRGYRGAAQSICSVKDSITKDIPTIFHNGSNYSLSFYDKLTSRRI